MPVFSVNTAQARSNREIVARSCVRHSWKELDVLVNSKPKGNILWVIRLEDIDEVMRERKESQWIARVPGLQDFCKKVAFAEIMAKLDAPWWPKTYILPEESPAVEKICSKKKNPTTLIFKPDEGSQGDGIFLLQTKTDIERKIQQLGHSYQSAIVQEYLPDPLLLDGYKFDMRLYVLVMSVYPVRALLCREGLVRVCTQVYEKPSGRNLHKVNAHLTNYSLNKLSALFVHTNDAESAESGSKRALSAVLPILGIDVDKFWLDIATMVRQCSRAVLDLVTPVENCFHVLGFDVLLDSNGKPYLLEVNNNPSMNIDTATPVDPPKQTRAHSSSAKPAPKQATGTRARSGSGKATSSHSSGNNTNVTSSNNSSSSSSIASGLPPGAKLCKCMAHYKPHYHAPCPVDVAVKSQVCDGALQMVNRVITGVCTLKAEDSGKLTEGLNYWDVTASMTDPPPPAPANVIPLDLTITSSPQSAAPPVTTTTSNTTTTTGLQQTASSSSSSSSTHGSGPAPRQGTSGPPSGRNSARSSSAGRATTHTASSSSSSSGITSPHTRNSYNHAHPTTTTLHSGSRVLTSTATAPSSRAHSSSAVPPVPISTATAGILLQCIQWPAHLSHSRSLLHCIVARGC
eukprot:TRINITY_DN1332_c0_g1_i1.p1 TRINITY_DN1332_c0_g1~~TRINITY_DN1332_c0_g1_i1.p1  ORF type:complete len:629 (-),score=39.49 TRINITY_DN1332_c0_g1_i1:94-1980(-)